MPDGVAGGINIYEDHLVCDGPPCQYLNWQRVYFWHTEAYCMPGTVLCTVQYCLALHSERCVWKHPDASHMECSTIHVLQGRIMSSY